jgi:mercuric ion transport protein
MIGAILASTCCIVPLALLTVGVSGAWIGTLTALEPYKPVFAGIAIGSIALGFRQVYFGRRTECEDGTNCTRPGATLVTKSALWLATALVVSALTISWWAPLLY